jgi:hypothetical protein
MRNRHDLQMRHFILYRHNLGLQRRLGRNIFEITSAKDHITKRAISAILAVVYFAHLSKNFIALLLGTEMNLLHIFLTTAFIIVGSNQLTLTQPPKEYFLKNVTISLGRTSYEGSCPVYSLMIGAMDR